MKHHRITHPKSKARRKRFEAWLSTATAADLNIAYERALKSFNSFQRIAINTELRKRELDSENDYAAKNSAQL
jgi:hypothetical protein